MVVVALVLATSWSPVVAGHPAYLVTLILVAVGGLVAMTFASFTLRSAVPALPDAPDLPDPPPDAPAPRPARSRARTWGLWIGRAVATVVVVGLLGVLWWLRPLGASNVALDALQSGNGVTVVQSATRIELRPTGEVDPTGLIFYPGAKVDARAYAHILRPVAEAGHLVVIVKMPFGIAFVDINAASSVIAAEDGVRHWVVAGHSLGGVAAARFASTHPDQVDGLVLWASYPAGSLAPHGDLTVLSVSGTNDGLTTPADVLASKPDLPRDTTFVAVRGAVHADFGDYGTQKGDGTPTIPREDAQRQITAATLAFLTELDQTR